MTNQENEWVVATEAWSAFVRVHPELGYRAGKWPLYNFLRLHRPTLEHFDAIRKAKRRFWIAHTERFPTVAFDAATGLYDPDAYSKP